MYDDILLPYDGSEGATAGLRHAAEIADWADATIHVLFVADTTRDSVTVVENQVVDALVREGENIVSDAEESLRGLGAEYESDVVQGNPAPTIAEYADRYGHDLIVMPTHAREGASRYLAGSVTAKVVRLASVPVLTVRMRADERLAFPYEDVLIPTDGSAGATHAAEHGLAMAAALNATVHALSAVDDTSIGAAVRSVLSGDERERDANEAVDDLVAAAADRGVTDTVRHVEHGPPVECILDAIESHDIDAVVMGTTGRRGTGRILLGSVAERTVREAPVPVVTVKDGE